MQIIGIIVSLVVFLFIWALTMPFVVFPFAIIFIAVLLPEYLVILLVFKLTGHMASKQHSNKNKNKQAKKPVKKEIVINRDPDRNIKKNNNIDLL